MQKEERRLTVRSSAIGRRFLRDRGCGRRHKDQRGERAGAEGGRSRRSHKEEKAAREKIKNFWARIVRPHDGWCGEIQRALFAMAVLHSKFEAASASRNMEEQRQGPGHSDEMVWVAPRGRKRRREGEAEKSHWSTTGAARWLPFHLILGRLPVRQLCQLPCVCKNRDWMLEAGEVQMETNDKREDYWFLMVQPVLPGQANWNFMAFSSHSDTQGRKDWAFFRPPLPSHSHSKLFSLLGGLHCRHLYKQRHFNGYAMPRLVSRGGLMCTFVRTQRGAPDVYHIIVFNCLTGSVKVLPLPLDPHHLFWKHSRIKLCYMHLAIDDVDPTRYYIMLTRKDEDQDPAYFEIFDSRIGSWKVGRSPKVATIANRKVAEGDFFRLRELYGTPTLSAYHAADDVWSTVEVPKLGTAEVFSCAYTLLKCKGRLLKAAPLTVRSHNQKICLGFAVMELQMTSSQYAVWVEVAITPQHLWHWLSYVDWHAEIKAEGSLFCMTIIEAHMWGQSNPPHVSTGRFQPPLVYDVAQNNWYVLPSERGTVDFGCIAVHRPRLSMRMPSLADSESSDVQCISPTPYCGRGKRDWC